MGRVVNAIMWHRLAHWLHRHRVPFLPKLVSRLIFLLYNSSIPAGSTIGKGSRFAYGAIGVVHEGCVIGERVMIGQNVTVGGSFGSDVPRIGDNVFIGPGVRILGGIRIGSNVILGANAVVVRDVPDNCIACGVPARVRGMIAAGTEGQAGSGKTATTHGCEVR